MGTVAAIRKLQAPGTHAYEEGTGFGEGGANPTPNWGFQGGNISYKDGKLDAEHMWEGSQRSSEVIPLIRAV